jgi:hypothetical protein
MRPCVVLVLFWNLMTAFCHRTTIDTFKNSNDRCCNQHVQHAPGRCQKWPLALYAILQHPKEEIEVNAEPFPDEYWLDECFEAIPGSVMG